MSSRLATKATNHPAAGKAGIARLFATEQYCPGLPEPGRWTWTITP